MTAALADWLFPAVAAFPDEAPEELGHPPTAGLEKEAAVPTSPGPGLGYFVRPATFSAVRMAPRPSSDSSTVTSVSVPVSSGNSVT